ncbi:hypothetical protein ACFYNO_02185 [Kitasatospora sp. NPDC006697]|uniref:hypothetical protein n=1 Tax=Kitasatospora sp. NPDC006697 TaxID=3364020 RepID=UPI003693E4CA
MRRTLPGILLVLVLVAGAVYVFVGRGRHHGPAPVPTVAAAGLIGSEKQDFFADKDADQAFRSQGLAVSVRQAGSWNMGSMAGPGTDFAIPASSVTAQAVIKADSARYQGEYTVFYSPLVMLSTVEVAKALGRKGVAEQTSDGTWIIHMKMLLTAITSTDPALNTWDAITTNPPAWLKGPVYVATTPTDTSSSASLFLATMSYLANGSKPVASTQELCQVAPQMRQLIQAEGGSVGTNNQLTSDWASGISTKPLTWTYESEAAEQVLAGVKPPNGVVLYPDFYMPSDHTLVQLSPKGGQVKDALLHDRTLLDREAHYGFRPAGDPTAFAKAVEAKGASSIFPSNLPSVGLHPINPPETSILQSLSAIAAGTAAPGTGGCS